MLKGWLSRAIAALAAVSTFAFVNAQMAFAKPGQAVDGQLGLQTPVTEIARGISDFHFGVNVVIFLITFFVLALLVYVMVRFNEKANPTPSKNAHNTLLEVAWTVVPIVILVGIAIPSFKLLNDQYTYPKPDLTIKATGYQWYWGHEYPDYDDVGVESRMLGEEDRKARIAKGIDAPRNLAVDYDIVVPVNKVVHVLVRGEDVIHNWTIPSFGSKIDAVPGRVTSTWFKAEQEGIYYGQCSELCGKDHAFMPIAVRVVKQDVFDKWIKALQDEDEDVAQSYIESAALEAASNKSVADASGATQAK